MRSIVISCLLLLISMPLMAQECDTSQYQLSLPSERFTVHDDGTVTDNGTGSVWMRCALGQEWDGKTCTGEATLYSLAELETLADELNLDGYAGHDDWRIPNLPELATITERLCKNPRTNIEIFPNTLLMAYWTSMSKPGTDEYYVMNFGEGGVKGADSTYRGPVRMLRGEKWWFPPSVRELKEQEKNTTQQ